MTRTPGRPVGGANKATPKKKSAPGVIVQSLLKRFEKAKQPKPEVLKKRYTSQVTGSGVKLIRNRYQELESSSSSEEMEQRQKVNRTRAGKDKEKEKETAVAAAAAAAAAGAAGATGGAEDMDTQDNRKRQREDEEKTEHERRNPQPPAVEDETENDRDMDLALKLQAQREVMKKALDTAGVSHLMGIFDKVLDDSVEIVKEHLVKRIKEEVKKELKDELKKEVMEDIKDEVRGMILERTKYNRENIEYVVRMTNEGERCSRTVIIYNADALLAGGAPPTHYGVEWGLASAVGQKVYTLCQGMVTVVNAYTLGRWKEGKAPTTVAVEFQTIRMKGVFYRVLAACIRMKNEWCDVLKKLSARDMFPKERMEEANMEVRRGMYLKKAQKIVSFKVLCRTAAAFPVLEIKRRGVNGVPGSWEEYRKVERDLMTEAEFNLMRDNLGEGEDGEMYDDDERL